MKSLIGTLIGNVRLKVNKLLTTPLPCTTFPPHFSCTSDKSTPGRTTNHAIMILVPINGKRVAIPIGGPKVYSTDEGRNC